MVRAGDRKERGAVGKRTNSYSDLGILSGGRSKNCNRGNSVMQAFPNPTRPISYVLRDCSTLQSLPGGFRQIGKRDSPNDNLNDTLRKIKQNALRPGS